MKSLYLWLMVRGWNQKFLDYEIETIPRRAIRRWVDVRWNQKFLDYEIETLMEHYTP